MAGETAAGEDWLGLGVVPALVLGVEVVAVTAVLTHRVNLARYQVDVELAQV